MEGEGMNGRRGEFQMELKVEKWIDYIKPVIYWNDRL